MNQPDPRIKLQPAYRTAWLMWSWSVVIGPMVALLVVFGVNRGVVDHPRTSWATAVLTASFFINWLASIKLAWLMTTGHTPLRRVIPFVLLAIALVIGGAAIVLGISMIGCAGAQAVTK
jgi:hypothetical protein